MRLEKKQIVQEIKSLLQDRPFILINYHGMSAETLNGFRGRLQEIEAQCHVVPNRLLLRAADELGLQDVASAELAGDTAMVSGDCDPVAMAKLVSEFIKEQRDKISIKWAYIEHTLICAAETAALAELPPREVLLAQLLGLLEAPASQLVRVLNAKVASIVYVLNAFLQKKEQAA
ncbi:MAG: 50S ribosomal protein L10 [Oligosphaeraceae bacterium]|nr:50S ribosomal protein L10 [Oligosphaeraceae bacterium]